MTRATFHQLREAYTANMVKAEPDATPAYIGGLVACCILRYAAASLDPGTFCYYPHPNTPAEDLLAHAATHVARAL
jgi:hypothetical protein